MGIRKVEHKILRSKMDIYKYHILFRMMFIDNIQLTTLDVKILNLLLYYGKVPLSDFCSAAVKYIHGDISGAKFAGKSQSIRNSIRDLVINKLINQTDLKGRTKSIEVVEKYNLKINSPTVYSVELGYNGNK